MYLSEYVGNTMVAWFTKFVGICLTDKGMQYQQYIYSAIDTVTIAVKIILAKTVFQLVVQHQSLGIIRHVIACCKLQ